MDIHSASYDRFGLKELVVKLERCDKIWETLKLIRNLHEDFGDIGGCIKREPVTPEKVMNKKPPMTFIPDKTLPLNLIGEPNLPYIKYQPIFNSVDESYPQFKLSEKSRVNLYHCEVCSQEYCSYKRFTDHQETVHGIIVPKKLLTKKERSQSKGSRRNSTESNNAQLVKKFVADENIELQTIVNNSSASNDSFRCKLCDKSYKNIKRHMVEYHKIKCFEVLGKVTDQNSNIEKNQSPLEVELFDSNFLKGVEETEEISQNIQFSTHNSNNVLKRRLAMPNIGLRKKSNSTNHQEKETDVGNTKDLWKCEICNKTYVQYKWFRAHKLKHNIDGYKPHSEVKRHSNDSRNTLDEKSCDKFVENRGDDDKDNRVPLTGSSLTKDSCSSDELKSGSATALGYQRDKKRSQIICSCGRSFRTRAILSEHKLRCKSVNSLDTCKPNETRTSTERDSGISITIKKKNNSYEIVSKDGSDEEALRNGHGIGEPEISEDTSDSSSDNSDSSDFDDQLENLLAEKSKYSANHRIMVLEQAEEDVDVDIEDEPCIENHNTDADKNVTNKISIKNHHQVPTLRDLCKRFFIKQGKLTKEETAYRCKTCKMYLGSKEKLSKHIDKHKKLMKRSCSCGIKFSAMRTFDDHIAEKHPTCTVCPYCKEKYTSIVGLGEHTCLVNQGAPYTEIYNENHPCPNCNIAFNTITWLQSHMRSKHLDPALPFQCYQCLAKFPNEIGRSLHAHEQHNRESVCTVCNQKFQSVKTKQKHEAYHRGVGFPCHSCKKTYRSKRNYLNHVTTVHGDFSNAKLQCSICQKSIKTKSFKKHVLRHNSILKCEMCDKVVYDFRNLERHIMDCHGNENYPRKKCNVCGVSFPTREQLEAHIVIEKSVRNERYKDA